METHSDHLSALRAACFEGDEARIVWILNVVAITPGVDPVPAWAYAAEHVTIPSDWESVDLTRWAWLPTGLWMARWPVTCREWASSMTPRPEQRGAPHCPVTHLSWHEALSYCNTLSRPLGAHITPNNGPRTLVFDHGQSSGPGHAWMLNRYPGFRLPTQREWRHALGDAYPRVCPTCFGGVLQEPRACPRCRGAGHDNDAIAWHVDNAQGQRHQVGLRQPNQYGLFDMLGNVWEWTWEGALVGGSHRTRVHTATAHPVREGAPTMRAEDVGLRICRRAPGTGPLDKT